MSKNIDKNDLKDEKYTESYSEDSFWDKVKDVALKVGAKGIYYALILYFVLQRDDIPYKVKAIIIGALGYFIFPIDVIPDIIPVVGYTDDIGALLLAIGQVSMYIDENVKNSAKQQMKQWFDISDTDLADLV